MAGPQHKACNCRCLPPFPCIEGCPKSGLFTYDTVALTMTAPTYAYTTASDTFTYQNGTAVVNVYNPDVTAIGGSSVLRRRPNLSSFGYGYSQTARQCEWLWNDVRAVQSKWFDPTNNYTCLGGIVALDASIEDRTPYIPVNAIDPLSPWDRVLVPNPDYACNTCYCAGCGGTPDSNPRQYYRCGNFIYFTAGSLFIREGGPPAATPPTITGGVGGGYWYWVFDFIAYSGISWSFNRGTGFPVFQPPSHNAMSDAGTAPMDITNRHPNFGGRVVGGRALDSTQELSIRIRYVKQINCETDFEGASVTLPFDYIVPAGNVGEDFVMTTYPPSVSIAFTP